MRSSSSASATSASSRLASGVLAFQASQTLRAKSIGGGDVGEGVVEPALRDDGAGAEVRQDVGDAPLGRVGAAGQLVGAHLGDQVVEPADGGAERFDVWLSH